MSTISTFSDAVKLHFDRQDAAIAGLQGDVKNLDDQITALQNSSGGMTPEDQALLDGIQARMQSITQKLETLDALTPPADNPPPPPTEDDAAILAALTDYSPAGVDNRLGPKGEANADLPDIWTRGTVPATDLGWDQGAPPFPKVSEGLSIMGPPPDASGNKKWYDFGGNDLNLGYVSDRPLTVNPGNPAAINSDGNGVKPFGTGNGRLRNEDHSNGSVLFSPDVGYNTLNAFPDDQDAVKGHTASYGMGDRLGPVLKMNRGRINRHDGGLCLYGRRGGDAYLGTIPTTTAWSPWSGLMLPSNFIPLDFCMSSQNEFAFVSGHNEDTGMGEVLVIALWGGPYNDNGRKKFPFDFNSSYPGLLQSGVIVGMKLIGRVALPVKWPTSVSCATSRNTGSNRIEGLDGNAAYLQDWDLSTKANRDAFLSKNGGWIANWGKLVIASKPEHKVVQMDATALYAGYRDQYFTTQEKYDAAKPKGAVTGNFWELFPISYGPPDDRGHGEQLIDNNWPYMLPGWTPTVTRVLDITSPTQVWMLETNNGSFVIGDEGGMLRRYKDDGTPNGSLQLGANIVSIKDDKYVGVTRGAMVVVSRSDRAIYRISAPLVNGVYGDMQVTQTIQDAKLVDPVDAGTSDTHGIETPLIWALDFDGKKVIQYRCGLLKLATQGGAVFGVGPTAQADKEAADQAVKDGLEPIPPKLGVECVGIKAVPGYPFTGSDSNIN